MLTSVAYSLTPDHLTVVAQVQCQEGLFRYIESIQSIESIESIEYCLKLNFIKTGFGSHICNTAI